MRLDYVKSGRIFLSAFDFYTIEAFYFVTIPIKVNMPYVLL